MLDDAPAPAGRTARVAAACQVIAGAFGPYFIVIACLGASLVSPELAGMRVTIVTALFGAALMKIDPNSRRPGQ